MARYLTTEDAATLERLRREYGTEELLYALGEQHVRAQGGMRGYGRTIAAPDVIAGVLDISTEPVTVPALPCRTCSVPTPTTTSNVVSLAAVAADGEAP